MDLLALKTYINDHRHSIAFIIGNGINRFNNSAGLSWDALLVHLWHRVTTETLQIRPNGISVTEFYDVLELLNNNQEVDLHKEVANLLGGWTPLIHHQHVVNKIKEWNAPILTTNYDETLRETGNFQLFHLKWTNDFYPWSSYHGSLALANPLSGFGIWYINGLRKYHRSIRLGLSDYMGSVERARRLIHSGDDRLFNGKAQYHWKGRNTWLHIIFNKSLIIFGLGLEENETFLRWLLIERKRYFKEFQDRSFLGWYMHVNERGTISSGKRLFLESVGIEVIEVDTDLRLYSYLWE
ncbi:hypothetical protein JHJ32_21940 [Parapedobacter sp. ISTM3]|uniref:hypothetical protein n=1 Tax=Parapedobacter sp. ISTM3 TaxID=2800130 RepID=UPI001904FCFC|nr:hypothetical protein [Parapedobacter sp. ISTM3]MBK1442677.1 hypothetical protein [Parapedobacter sp. ISTM3]